jgi:hypothetical protein
MPFVAARGSEVEDGQGIISWIGHSLSGAALVGSIVGWFPGVAAVVALLWYGIQIYESKTYQNWKQGRRLRKLAVLRIEMARLEALELVAHPVNVGQVQLAQATAESVVVRAAKVAAQVLEAAKPEDKE